MKQEAKKRIQDYLKKNDELFEQAAENDKIEASLVAVARHHKAVYTLKQALDFCNQFLENPPQPQDFTLTWYQLPGFTHYTRGWIWQQQDGYFFIKCGGSIAYLIDRRFY